MIYKVSARCKGDVIKFHVETANEDLHEALQLAREKSRRIFDYKSGDSGAPPTVIVDPVDEDDDCGLPIGPIP